MSLLSVPLEIRLQIYTHLLVSEDIIQFPSLHRISNPRIERFERPSLQPSILRVSRMINREATPLLYSNNRFSFLDAWMCPVESHVPSIVAFLERIGANAGLLRHLCIDFPSRFDEQNGFLLSEHYAQGLRLIQEVCTGLTTVEISCREDEHELPFQDVNLSAKWIAALARVGFDAVASLEKVALVCWIDDEDVLARRGSLMLRMPSPKWTIEFRKLQPRLWICGYGMLLFDDEEDCRLSDEQCWQEELQEQE